MIDQRNGRTIELDTQNPAIQGGVEWSSGESDPSCARHSPHDGDDA